MEQLERIQSVCIQEYEMEKRMQQHMIVDASYFYSCAMKKSGQ